MNHDSSYSSDSKRATHFLKDKSHPHFVGVMSTDQITADFLVNRTHARTVQISKYHDFLTWQNNILFNQIGHSPFSVVDFRRRLISFPRTSWFHKPHTTGPEPPFDFVCHVPSKRCADVSVLPKWIKNVANSFYTLGNNRKIIVHEVLFT